MLLVKRNQVMVSSSPIRKYTLLSGRPITHKVNEILKLFKQDKVMLSVWWYWK